MTRSYFRADYQSVFLCVLTLVLMLLPSALEVVILLFIFAAEILGEINGFYVRVPNWDPMLDDRMITASSQNNDVPVWNTASNEAA